jgi:LacI family transcriptional regulator
VAVSGHGHVDGVTNIVLDHKLAARLALTHLARLGHEDIAFLKGHTLSSDSATRWNAVCEIAAELGIAVRPELTAQIDSTISTPHLGYPITRELLSRGHSFTALFAYNDISAIGATWALREAGLRVPQDISVVGFDDIPAAAFNTPSLSTVRQPLERMGQIAAKTLIDRIEGNAEYVDEIAVEPEFVARDSSGPVPSPYARPFLPDIDRVALD